MLEKNMKTMRLELLLRLANHGAQTWEKEGRKSYLPLFLRAGLDIKLHHNDMLCQNSTWPLEILEKLMQPAG